MGRKYSLLLLDEAADCYQKHGGPYAAKMTGVNIFSIKLHAWKMRKLACPGLNRGRVGTTKYTYCQKLACIKLALRLAETGMAKSVEHGFKIAGERLKMNGMKTFYRYRLGTQPLGLLAQQPSKELLASGFSIQAASPQDQRCEEQLRELLSKRPAPKIVNRRKFTSADLPDSVRFWH